MRGSHRLSRRHFLRQSSLAVASAFAAPAILRARALNERVNLAFIGVGGRGGSNLRTLASPNAEMVNVVSLCDVNAQNLDKAAAEFPMARTYADFRKLYDEHRDLDAVVVSTTEHTHAYATLPALKLGKHVYCEKPLTQNVVEARLVTAAAAEAGVVTQMGTQIHGMPNYRRVVELIRTGAIGPVREAHVWVLRAWGLQSKADAETHKDIVYVTDRPTEAMTPPAHLNWDLWLGPAAARPYHDVYFPGPKWYRWWEFGNGTMSDLGSHWVDLPWWALELDAPLTIEAKGDLPPHPEIAPASMTAVYQYGPRGQHPACSVTWYQGTHKPKIWTEKGIRNGHAVLFVGDKGMLLSDYGKHVLLPEDQYKDFVRPEPFIPDSPGQHQEWLNAIRTGGKTSSPFSYAGPLTEANHLGNVAFRAGQKIEWDRVNLRLPNCPAAERFLTREPRAGWSLG